MKKATRKRYVKVILGAAALAAVGTASTGVAHARGTGTAPACIKRTVVYTPPSSPDGYFYNTVTVENHCGKTMKIQVDWQYHPDSPCTTMANGARKVFRESANYQRTETCT